MQALQVNITKTKNTKQQRSLGNTKGFCCFGVVGCGMWVAQILNIKTHRNPGDSSGK